MQPQASIRIDIDNMFARINPCNVAPLITPALCYPSTQFAPNGSGGYTKARRQYRCFDREDGGALRILVGHVPRVKDLLERAGLTVTVQDHRQFGSKATPSLQVIEEAHGDARAFLEIVAREPRGLLEMRRQAEMLQLTALLCRLFPAARIYIPVATRRQVARTRRELQRTLGAPVNVYEDYPWPWEGGRLVCTLRAFDHHNACDLEVVVCPEACHAAVPGHFEAFGKLPFQRIYGFVRADQTFSAKGRLRLEGLFGPVVYRVPDPRGPEATVCVHWCLPPESSRIGEISVLERKRHTCWHNEGRNDLIAALAAAFRAGDREQLWEHGLLLADDEDALLAAGPRSCAILVESVEHGRELLRRLPGWRLWDTVPAPPQPNNLPPGVESIWDFGTCDKVILTLVQASRLESVYTDVLVVASGVGWPDVVPGFPPRRRWVGHQVFLIDLADDFDCVARQATLRRQCNYISRGWRVSKVPAWMQQVP